VPANDRSFILTHSSVNAPTAAKYERASQLFKHWALARKAKSSSEPLTDIGLCKYLTCLYEAAAYVCEGRYTIYGWLFMYSVTALLGMVQLPMSTNAIKRWNLVGPGSSRFPQPIDVICLLILELLNICVLSADAAILQYDGHADRAKTAKTMQQDDTVIVGLGPRFWVHHTVETLFHRTKPGELLFESLCLAPH
jgi:hypothetical protein